MQLNDERLLALKNVLAEEGIVLPDEELHDTALSVLRFVVAKAANELINMEKNDDN
jgi:hypothetical protein